MYDREKVINDLQDAVNDDWIWQHADYYALTMERAIALLKEQEAVSVTQREIAHMLFWCCGSCGAVITDGDKFCRMCGQAVKWE